MTSFVEGAIARGVTGVDLAGVLRPGWAPCWNP